MAVRDYLDLDWQTRRGMIYYVGNDLWSFRFPPEPEDDLYVIPLCKQCQSLGRDPRKIGQRKRFPWALKQEVWPLRRELWHLIWTRRDSYSLAEFWALRRRIMDEYPNDYHRLDAGCACCPYFGLGVLEWEALKREILESGF